MSGSIDPYKILGVAQGATLEEIRQAYRRAATKYHPDAGGDAWAFHQVQQAYDTLRAKFEGERSAASSKKQASATPPQPADRRAGNASQKSSNPSDRTNPQSASGGHNRATEDSKLGKFGLKQWLFGQPLRLHDETSYFILANFLDLVMTGILLRYSAVEANPIANYFYQRWGFYGMVALKIASVVFVCVVAQSIAARNELKGKILLIGGTLLVSAVVVYSIFLAQRQLAI